ncbi:MAG: four helix bundle protein [Myxococcota bacterium]|nr:four helix bundle protein [Myxococcota bacterium]
MPLSIENLDAYRLAISLNRSIAALDFPKNRAHLRDQGVRAADSVVLNIAEGMGRGRLTNAGKNHMRIAKGSLLEVYAVLDLLNKADQHRVDIERLDRLLYGLQR